jgi:hypothetical protein
MQLLPAISAYDGISRESMRVILGSGNCKAGVGMAVGRWRVGDWRLATGKAKGTWLSTMSPVIELWL